MRVKVISVKSRGIIFQIRLLQDRSLPPTSFDKMQLLAEKIWKLKNFPNQKN